MEGETMIFRKREQVPEPREEIALLLLAVAVPLLVLTVLGWA